MLEWLDTWLGTIIYSTIALLAGLYIARLINDKFTK